MLGDRQRGMGGRAIAAIASLVAAYVFGSTAWQQFAPLPQAGRVFSTAVFVVVGAGVIWLVYGLIRLVLYLYPESPRGLTFRPPPIDGATRIVGLCPASGKGVTHSVAGIRSHRGRRKPPFDDPAQRCHRDLPLGLETYLPWNTRFGSALWILCLISVGHILAPCHNVQAVSPPANVVALYEAGYELGKIPG